MFRIKLVGVAALLVGASLLTALIAGEANADGICSNISGGNVNVYSVKFTCGPQTGTDDDVVTGVYRTSINIHNPQNQTVNFCTKVVVPQPSAPSTITKLVPQTLKADDAMFINCFTPQPQSISGPNGQVPDPGFEFEGFVVIEVPQPSQYSTTPPLLDVVGKYTARPAGSDVSSLQVVVYSPTPIPKH